MSHTYSHEEHTHHTPSFEDFIDALREHGSLDTLRRQNTDVLLGAIKNGFIYDCEGELISQPFTLDRQETFWKRSHPGGTCVPLYFLDPSVKDGELYFLKTDGSLGGGRLDSAADIAIPGSSRKPIRVRDLLEKDPRVRNEQPTKETEIPEMTFWEKVGHFFSFGLWKPTRIRQAERQCAVSRMERLKMAESMGYPASDLEKAEYASIWNMDAVQKQQYITGRPQKQDEPEIRVPMLSGNITTLKTERQKTQIRTIAPKITEKLDKLGLTDAKYQYGLGVIREYLQDCRQHPDPDAQMSAIKLLQNAMVDPYERPYLQEFAENLSILHLDARQMGKVLKRYPVLIVCKDVVKSQDRLNEALGLPGVASDRVPQQQNHVPQNNISQPGAQENGAKQPVPNIG